MRRSTFRKVATWLAAALLWAGGVERADAVDAATDRAGNAPNDATGHATRGTKEDLPPEYREVVRLSRLEGLKTKEVAERLGKSPDSVKHLLARAIQALRGKLDETGSLLLPDRRLGGES